MTSPPFLACSTVLELNVVSISTLSNGLLLVWWVHVAQGTLGRKGFRLVRPVGLLQSVRSWLPASAQQSFPMETVFSPPYTRRRQSSLNSYKIGKTLGLVARTCLNFHRRKSQTLSQFTDLKISFAGWKKTSSTYKESCTIAPRKQFKSSFKPSPKEFVAAYWSDQALTTTTKSRFKGRIRNWL